MESRDAKEEEKKDRGGGYFNNAGKTALLPSVMEAGVNAIRSNDNTEEDCSDEVRRLFGTLLNCGEGAENVAIVPSTSFAMTLAAHNLKEKLGKVLLLQDEMPSAIYCWQEVCKEVEGASLEVVTFDDGGGCCRGWTEAVVQRIRSDESITVACLPQAHWSDGSLLDLIAIGNVCRRHDVSLVVDATQTLGIYPFDVRTIRPDCVAASVHKWLLGPVGMSLMYIAPHHSWMPLDQHQRSRTCFLQHGNNYNAYENRMTQNGGYPEELPSGARRCDSGGKKNPILMPMVLAGLTKVMELDLRACQ